MLNNILSRKGQTVLSCLRDFFASNPLKLPIAAKSYSSIDLPNLHLAIESIAKKENAPIETIGYVKHMSMISNSLRDLLIEDSYDRAMIGPVQYREVEIGEAEPLFCMEDGLFLVTLKAGRVAALIRTDTMKRSLQLELIAETRELAVDFLARVRDSIGQRNVYRGKVISLEGDDTQGTPCKSPMIRFHHLQQVTREQIILPEAVLQVMERNTIGFFKHGPKLAKSGRSMRRGLLLYGKPGTGKTFTARWLAQSIPGLTVILMSGEQLWLIRECCQIARMLAPSLVIMEDVDLIASARDEARHPMFQVTLHQLLNEMDGIDAPAPILFLLTTNRPDAIEPAIASRPGRVDQAIEYPLPDSDCRRRLILLYGEGLDLALTDIEAIVSRTEGASPAFIQEMLRKAALLAAEEGSSGETIRVAEEHCHAAIRELLFSGGELTQRLLGFVGEAKG